MKKYWNLLLCLFLLVFTAACSGNSSDDEPEGETGELLLVSSAAYIENNGTDQAVFTVMKGKKDVTAEAKIYQKKGSSYDVLPSVSFSSKTQGDYSFFASYNNEMSPTITVMVTSGMLALPEDPQPDKFEGFKHRLLAVQATSLGCVYCPLMIAGLTEYAKLEDSKNTVLVAAHGIMDGDDMISEYSTGVLQALSLKAAPALLFNMRPSSEALGIYNSETPANVAARIQTTANDLLKTEANTGISAAVSGTEASGSIKVTAAVKVGKTGKYRICAWVVEDDIYATGQLNNYPTLETTYDFKHHSNVLRCISSTSPVTGVNLGGKTECQAGETLKFSYEFSLKDMTVANLANARVVFIVTQSENGTRYTVDNAVSCGLNNQVKFEYK
ncbi:MAG: hypothetical protein BHV75_13145 [Bacteroides oleiciplenus]|nr:MAG: hypothetical protein BHV75_13145 [Bacteroides oleiciplenus]